ncbi:hypothetical protein V1512DRAFT_255801 [Lipomyces arxii]|uniref:uncharacterized protein n=1 Tax=Lipomyces arxii TaxID=56418 RepID=UPI0034CE0A7C
MSFYTQTNVIDDSDGVSKIQSLPYADFTDAVDYGTVDLRQNSSDITCVNGSASSQRDLSTTARLNAILCHLNEIFPDTEVDLLRQLMVDNRGTSQLYAIVEILLSSPALLAKRRRVRHAYLADWERFRAKEYRVAVTKVLRAHFSSLHSSTIDNVLVQNNYSYTCSMPTLTEIAFRRASRWSFLKLFRKRQEPTPGIDIQALVGNTGSRELDAELKELDKSRLDALCAQNEHAARELNKKQYETFGQLIECECCFGDYAWEDLACCSDAHFFCHECLTSVVKEGLYGQGSFRGKTQVQCISASASPQCQAFIATSILRASLPKSLYAEFERAQILVYFTKNADRNGYVLCPFCTYAEEAAAAVTGSTSGLRFSNSPSLIPRLFWNCGPATVFLLFSFLLALLYFVLSAVMDTTLPEPIYSRTFGYIDKFCKDEVCLIIRGVFKRRHGTAFRCKNPECMKTSCTECHKEFLPFHKCYEQEEDKMRVFIEKAMADAVKRTCPQCKVSFIKSEGCNKLVCVCGYAMCYVCRKDIRQEGYQHFCDHFRPIPGRVCTECDKCDLYKVEDEAVSIERAAKDAEKEYIRTNGIPAVRSYGTDGWYKAVSKYSVLKSIEGLYISLADVLIAE